MTFFFGKRDYFKNFSCLTKQNKSKTLHTIYARNAYICMYILISFFLYTSTDVNTYLHFNLQRKNVPLSSVYVHASSSQEVPKIPTYEELYKEASEIEEWQIDIRRRIHMQPELMFKEYKTSEQIKKNLKSLNITFTGGWGVNVHNVTEGGTGVVADVGNKQNPCIAIRADMDALPIHEIADVPYVSFVPGVMHACGHDVHTAILLGVAHLLKKYEHLLQGTVRLIFQPAEEGGGGARMMREEGVLTKQPAVQKIFSYHVAPFLPSFVIGSKPHTVMAAADRFTITLRGAGGHAAFPYLAVDPITPAVSLVQSFNNFVARETFFHTKHAAVLSVTKIHAGDAFNVIPTEATVEGTFRSLTSASMKKIKKRIKEITKSVAQLHRCTYTITFSKEPYPPTVNDPELFDFFNQTVAEVYQPGGVIIGEATMGAEDFSFFTEHIPASFSFFGIGSGLEDPSLKVDTSWPLHSNKFAVDERVMKNITTLYAYTAFKAINQYLPRTNTSTSTNRSKDELQFFRSFRKRPKSVHTPPKKSSLGP